MSPAVGIYFSLNIEASLILHRLDTVVYMARSEHALYPYRA